MKDLLPECGIFRWVGMASFSRLFALIMTRIVLEIWVCFDCHQFGCLSLTQYICMNLPLRIIDSKSGLDYYLWV